MIYNENQARITALKQLLTSTDYKALKHSEGESSDEEYAPIRAKRQEWRDEINRLEVDLQLTASQT